MNHIKNKPKCLNQLYVVVLLEDETKIGLVSFPQNSEVNEKELLISFLPLHTGKKYGSEALYKIIKFWPSEINEDHLYATAMPENKASIAMLEKNGFKYIDKYKDGSRFQLLYKFEKNT